MSTPYDFEADPAGLVALVGVIQNGYDAARKARR